MPQYYAVPTHRKIALCKRYARCSTRCLLVSYSTLAEFFGHTPISREIGLSYILTDL